MHFRLLKKVMNILRLYGPIVTEHIKISSIVI